MRHLQGLAGTAAYARRRGEKREREIEFGALFRTLDPTVRKRAAHYARGDPDLIDDLTQEVWIRVHSRLRTYRGDGSVRRWVLRICDRIAIDHRRRLRRRSSVEAERYGFDPLRQEYANDSSNALTSLVEIENADPVINAILALPPKRRAFAISRFLSGDAPAAIAAKFGTTVGRVSKELSLARAAIRRRLGSMQRQNS
jgi:RNA polymerase sigma-70 factor (ECF subfamily)